VALATIIRSPKSWLTRRRYGVSPQPEQAPENSKSGSRTWDPLTVSCASRLRSSCGIERKKSQLRRSTSAWSSTGSMLMALWLDLGLALGRADVDAHAAAGAVVGRDLDREQVVGQVPRLELLGQEAGRGARAGRGREDLHPDRGVRADHGALAAVDADRGIPDRDRLGDGPLLVLRGSGGERPVDREAR
jgi:hypothetical protein